MIDYFRGAPKQLEEVRQKLADYEAMESSGSIGDFTAWLAGQATGGLWSPENLVGGAGKGASLLGRALWTGLKQFGVAAASDAVAQWLLIKAGFQKEFNPVQTVTSAVTAGVTGAAGKAGADGMRLGIASKSGSQGGKAPAAETRKSAEAPQHEKKPAQPSFAEEAALKKQPLTLRPELESSEAQTRLLQNVIGDYPNQAAQVKKLLGASDWNIPLPLAMAIRHYTGKIYLELNKGLREGSSTKEHRMLAELVAEGLKKLRPHRGDIWRAPAKTVEEAEHLWKAAEKPGASFDLGRQFQSFSTDANMAAEWSGASKLVVHIRNSKSGAYMGDVSHFPSQQEVLLPPGLRYKVVSRTKRSERSAVRVVELEVVDGK